MWIFGFKAPISYRAKMNRKELRASKSRSHRPMKLSPWIKTLSLCLSLLIKCPCVISIINTESWLSEPRSLRWTCYGTNMHTPSHPILCYLYSIILSFIWSNKKFRLTAPPWYLLLLLFTFPYLCIFPLLLLTAVEASMDRELLLPTLSQSFSAYCTQWALITRRQANWAFHPSLLEANPQQGQEFACLLYAPVVSCLILWWYALWGRCCVFVFFVQQTAQWVLGPWL